SFIREKVFTYLVYFGIPDKAYSYPKQLSAGQQQRAAIARAMVIEPALLLLDEPFANLDKNLKVETAEFIRGIQKKLGTTTVSVTHDQEEAFAMSDSIGILIAGRLVQLNTTRNVYYTPASWEAAKFLGPVNRIPSSLFSSLRIKAEGKEVLARAEALSVRLDPEGQGTIEKVCFVGAMILIDIKIDGVLLKSTSFNGNLEEGNKVSIEVLHYF
ncbi:MAG: ABC transporter ATP-binding protein, partial [Spirochaetia bacterium]|nr:ABC transporter ATP-binding protein [Spirochaetia bacterium]